MPPRVVVRGSVERGLWKYASGVSGREVGGFLMGMSFGSGAVVVTALSAVRTGRAGSVRLGEPPPGSVGWFHSRPEKPNRPLRGEARAHARLFPETARLVALLGGGDTVFFYGKGRSLEPVLAVESAELPLEPARFAEAVEALGLAGKNRGTGSASQDPSGAEKF